MRQRVQRLLEAGVMQIVAVTDPVQVGFSRQAHGRPAGGRRRTTVAEQVAALREVDYVVVTAGSFDLLVEVVCEDDEHLLDLVSRRLRALPGRPDHRNVRVPEAAQAALRLGNPMTTTPQTFSESRARTPASPIEPATTSGCTSPGTPPTRTAATCR